MTQVKSAHLDEAGLRALGLDYATRYGGTTASMARILDRRIQRWERAMLATEGADPEAVAGEAASLREAAGRVVASLASIGAVDDAAFAASRARRLRRSGRSRLAVLAHLGAKGVGASLAGATVPEDEAAEFAAALAFARRRRVGPFAREGDDQSEAGDRVRVLMAFGRAGFSGVMARRALECSPEEAERMLRAQPPE
ncbi:RecX family transcriptional regulator [Acidisoma sp.]|uniref:RecX family transcriptional regulator n=1 Tax=Acidisoma sp. TaxID=1872115 RepID=UPI003B00597F